jgi:hypothetical protein
VLVDTELYMEEKYDSLYGYDDQYAHARDGYYGDVQEVEQSFRALLREIVGNQE